jgi:hypothetical protein
MKKLISAVAVAAMLGTAQFAVAAPVQAAPVIHMDKGDFQIKKGKKLPGSAKRVVINKKDYHRWHLKTPPRGYQWVRVGNEFLMVAITTGIIFSILGAIAQH